MVRFICSFLLLFSSVKSFPNLKSSENSIQGENFDLKKVKPEDEIINILSQNSTVIDGDRYLRKRRSLTSRHEFNDYFRKQLQEDIDETAKELDLINFQRSICLLDLYNTNGRSNTDIKTYTNVDHTKLKQLIAWSLRYLFGATGANYKCDDCLTKFMQENIHDIVVLIDKLHEEITNGLSKTGHRNNEFVEVDFDLGESGYINYKIFYELKNVKPYESIGKEKKCSYLEILLYGCGSFLSNVELNLGMFIHISENKFRYNGNDKRTITRLNKDVVKNYYRYNMIKAAMDETFFFIEEPKTKDLREFDNFMKKVENVKDCEYSNKCVAPVCIDILPSMKEMNSHELPYNHIIMLEGSRSISSHEYQNSLKAIESKVRSVLDGKNKVTVFQFFKRY